MKHCQRGVTLAISLIMLVIITMLVLGAFRLSTGNLRTVANIQFRNEALAAANVAIDDVVSNLLPTGSLVAPPARVIDVDIDGDGTPEYKVAVQAPECVRAVQSSASVSSSVTLGPSLSTVALWNTLWDLSAAVSDYTADSTGASVGVHQGIWVLLTEAQRNAVCP
jgi:Tfp pilus assembly protein PilX